MDQAISAHGISGPTASTALGPPAAAPCPRGWQRGRWFVRRLRTAGPGELLIRAWRLARDTSHQKLGRWPVPLCTSSVDDALRPESPSPALTSPALEPADPALSNNSPSFEDCSELSRFVDRLLAGYEPIMGWGWREVGSPPEWRRDPLTRQSTPNGFGPRMNARDPSRFGEVRRIWELSRHHRWVAMAWALKDTAPSRCAETLTREINHWLKLNPYPEGVHWTSALEVGIRLVSWSWVEREAGRYLPDSTRTAMRKAAEYSVRFIGQHRSIGTSENNHAIGEAVGLIVAADTWPQMPRAAWARRSGWRILHRVLPRLVGADGFPLEQSISYGLFTLDLALEALSCSSADEYDRDNAIRRRAGALASALLTFDELRPPPLIGDNDEGRALPAPDPRSYWDAVLASASSLLERPRPPRTAWGRMVTRCRGLQRPTNGEPEVAGPTAESTAFPQGGLVKLTAGPITALMDVGELGYGALAAHGHADCLQVLLWLDGHAVLTDPGMPCYEEHPSLRDAFRSTFAHNTAVVGDADQSQMLGRFLWGRRARPQQIRWHLSSGAPQWVEAAHDGYARGTAPVVHRRRLKLHAAAAIVEDHIDATRSLPPWSVQWWFHPAWTVEPRPAGWMIQHPHARSVLHLSSTCPLELLTGQTAPRFGATIPISGLVARPQGPRLTTTFQLHDRSAS